MIIADALKSIHSICVDTAPFIYYVEQNPDYFDRAKAVFEYAGQGITFITSVLTLTEILMKPIQAKNIRLQREYHDLFLNTTNIATHNLNFGIASQAAQLRAQYNLRTPDAIQIATGISTGCAAFLTNNKKLKRITQLTILVLDELQIR